MRHLCLIIFVWGVSWTSGEQERPAKRQETVSGTVLVSTARAELGTEMVWVGLCIGREDRRKTRQGGR